MTNDVKKTLITEVQPVDGRGAPASPRPRKAHHDKQFSSSYQPPNRGRHLGSVGRITRTMKDAVIAAADELGQVDPALWPEHVKGDPGQGRVKPSWSRFGGGAALIERHNIGRVSIVGRDQRHGRLG
jgi:hypothetical protein